MDENTIISLPSDQKIKMYNSKNGDLLNTINDNYNMINALCVSTDGTKIASGSLNGTIKIWDITNSKLINSFKQSDCWLHTICFNHDGNQIAYASYERKAKIICSTTGDLINELIGHTQLIHLLFYNFDGSIIASSSDDDTCKIWNSTNGECLHTINSIYAINSISFNENKLAYTFFKTIVIIDYYTFETLLTIETIFENINEISFRGSKIVSASDCNIIGIWDSESGELINQLTGHDNWVNSVCFNYDATKIVSGSSNGYIKIWDSESGECLNTINSHQDSISYVLFIPVVENGSYVLK